jgi:hypothetical protein
MMDLKEAEELCGLYMEFFYKINKTMADTPDRDKTHDSIQTHLLSGTLYLLTEILVELKTPKGF